MEFKRETSLRKRDMEALREKAETIANHEPQLESTSALHDLRVHQIELELQNESLRKTQVELDRIRFLYFEIFELAPVGYLILSGDNIIQEANLTSTSLLGIDKNLLKNQKISNFILREHQDTFYLYTRRLFDTKETQKCEIQMLKNDGSSFWAQFVGTPRQDINGKTVYLNVLHDITDQKEVLNRLEYLCFHDSMTGLYNRRFMEEELKRLDVIRNLPISFIIGDVDRLKFINDAYGHDKGDELLIKVAEIIKSNCRPDDLVSRTGGDEFMVMLPKTTREEALSIVERMQTDCRSKKVEGMDISISLGVSEKKTDKETINSAILEAELEMYRQKRTHNPPYMRNEK